MKVVLLPGLDGTGVLFKPFIDALPSTADIQVMSYPSNTKLSYQKLTELVMSQLPKEQFILIGESFSGYIAYQVALYKPKSLKLVIFVATFLESPRPFLLALSRFFPRRLILSAPTPTYIIKYILFGLTVNKVIIELFRESMSQVSPEILSYRLAEISKLPDICRHSDVRSIYIQATNDKLVPKKCAESFKRMFKNINVFQIEGSHFILQSNPLACAEVIINEAAL